MSAAEPTPESCAHPVLRLSAEGVFCEKCATRIDDDVVPLPTDEKAALRTIHEIDQAHASATQRIDSLISLLDKWQKQSINSAAKEAAQNPEVFYTIVQIMRTRVDVTEFPYLIAAAVMRIAADRVPE